MKFFLRFPLFKFFRFFKFLLIFTALLLLPCHAAISAISAINSADSPPDWQLIITSPDGNTTIPLITDITGSGEVITLTDPLIPLRPLANVLGAQLSLSPADYPNAVLFAAADNAWLLLDDCPLAIHITADSTTGNPDGTPTAQLTDIFDPPQLIDNRFCMPISFLDLLNISYDIDPTRGIVSVSTGTGVAACPSPADEDTYWQAAHPLLDYLTTPRRQLLAQFTINADSSLTADTLLQIASTLHATTIAPGCTYTFPAALNISPVHNSSIFPLQLACRATPQSLTILLYQLNSPDVAQDYLGQIAP